MGFINNLRKEIGLYRYKDGTSVNVNNWSCSRNVKIFEFFIEISEIPYKLAKEFTSGKWVVTKLDIAPVEYNNAVSFNPFINHQIVDIYIKSGLLLRLTIKPVNEAIRNQEMFTIPFISTKMYPSDKSATYGVAILTDEYIFPALEKFISEVRGCLFISNPTKQKYPHIFNIENVKISDPQKSEIVTIITDACNDIISPRINTMIDRKMNEYIDKLDHDRNEPVSVLKESSKVVSLRKDTYTQSCINEILKDVLPFYIDADTIPDFISEFNTKLLSSRK